MLNLNKIPELKETIKIIYGINVDEKTNKREVVQVRQMLYFILHKETILSSTQLSKLIGNKDHATVLRSVKMCNNLCEVDRIYKDKFDEIKQLTYKTLNINTRKKPIEIIENLTERLISVRICKNNEYITILEKRIERVKNIKNEKI